MKNFLSIILFLFISSLFCGCSVYKTKYYNNLLNLIKQEDYASASTLAEQSKEKVYGNKNALLYYLDKGLLLHSNGNYEESNTAFERAKQISQDYFTKSITAEASTLLISDNTRPYYGESFERALIHVFSALNYIFLNDENSALIEARQVDHFLKTLQTNYGHKNVYKEDAFARYLMGMIYENQNDINNAYISYYKALEAYNKFKDVYNVSMPTALINDAVHTAKLLGFDNEVTNILNTWQAKISPKPKSYGELVIFHYNGICPVKIDNIFEISFGKAWFFVGQYQVQGQEEEQVDQAEVIARNIFAEEQVRVAFPKYVLSPYQIKNVTAQIDLPSNNQFREQGILVQNIGSIAEKSLESRITRIKGRAIARSVVKYTLAHKAAAQVKKQSNDDVLGWFTKKALTTLAGASEKADKRSWRSLPDQIRMIKISCKAVNL
ncbi:COG3014 family protein [bacterium]